MRSLEFLQHLLINKFDSPLKKIKKRLDALFLFMTNTNGGSSPREVIRIHISKKFRNSDKLLISLEAVNARKGLLSFFLLSR